MRLKGMKIAFLGDSITEGVGASSVDKCFVEQIKAQFEIKEAYNYGISGTRIAKQINASNNSMWDMDFISRVPKMEDDVDAVVVFGGTNDFGHGDLPFGNITDVNEDSFCGACDLLMSMLIEKYADVPIFFVTPLHRLTEEDLINEIGLARKTLTEYVEVIRKKAEKYSIPIIDLYAMSGMQPNIPVQNELYFIDGLHPNDRGHNRIAQIVGNI